MNNYFPYSLVGFVFAILFVFVGMIINLNKKRTNLQIFFSMLGIIIFLWAVAQEISEIVMRIH